MNESYTTKKSLSSPFRPDGHSSMRLIVSPWAGWFGQFARSVRDEAILVAPFISQEPLKLLTDSLDPGRRPSIQLLTNLAVDSLLAGTVDADAIARFCSDADVAAVTHLPGLHAKAYVADEHTAIITSGNLTSGSLYRNYEYGVQIDDPSIVRAIAADLRQYAGLGVEVSVPELNELGRLASVMKERRVQTLGSADAVIRRQFVDELERTQNTLRRLRASPGESTNSIFARTILYILRQGPLPTDQIHASVESVHPDICDNSIDRVINGVHFGRRWKHMVRNAQQTLKNRGQIELAEGKWTLVDAEMQVHRASQARWLSLTRHQGLPSHGRCSREPGDHRDRDDLR